LGALEDIKLLCQLRHDRNHLDPVRARANDGNSLAREIFGLVRLRCGVEHLSGEVLEPRKIWNLGRRE
jgi:hypothetical protein